MRPTSDCLDWEALLLARSEFQSAKKFEMFDRIEHGLDHP